MNEVTLMERNTAGLHVEVKWLPNKDCLVLEARAGEQRRAIVLPDGKTALHAFDHPCVYLPESNELFRA